MNDLSPQRTDKFRTYRARKKAAGLREVRMWVPDLRNSEVLAQWKREGELLRTHSSDKDAMDFIESFGVENAEFYD